MSQIFDSVQQFFTEDEWPFSDIGDNVLRTNFQGESGQWACFAQTREEQNQFVFYSVCPLTVPEDKRAVMADFLTRANYGMILGNFEMDFDDGEVRYKTSIDSNGDDLTPTFIRPLIYANVLMMDKYLPGVMAVTYGNIGPVEAIADIES